MTGNIAHNISAGADRLAPQTGLNAVLTAVDPETITFPEAPVLLNRSSRFIIPVPALSGGGEPLVVPEGEPEAGKAIYSNSDGSPQLGIPFRNSIGHGWSGVQGNGAEAIAINMVTKEQALALYAKIESITSDPMNMTPAQILTVLDYACKELGLIDMFDQDRAAVKKNLTQADAGGSPKDSEGNSVECFGYMKVNKPTEHRAVYIAEPFFLKGNIDEKFPFGGVVVHDGKYSWGVQTSVIASGWVRRGPDGLEEPIASVEHELANHTI